MARRRSMAVLLPGLLWPALAAAPATGQVTPPAEAVAPAGWLGIWFEHLAPSNPLGAETSTIVVDHVLPGSGAAAAGLRAGDVVIRVNGRPATLDEIGWAAGRLKVGDRMDLTVRRGSGVLTLHPEAGPRPATPPPPPPRPGIVRLPDAPPRVGAPERGMTWGSDRVVLREADRPLPGSRDTAFVVFRARPQTAPTVEDVRRLTLELGRRQAIADSLVARHFRVDVPRPEAGPLTPLLLGQSAVGGARVTALNPDLAAYFQVDEGLLVIDVADPSPAADAGILGGDVITEVDGSPVGSLPELRARMAMTSGSPRLTLVRGNRTIVVRLP